MISLQEEFVNRFSGVVNEMLGIMVQKRAMRGTGNITRQGIPGVVTRIAEDKMTRIQRHVSTMDLRIQMHKRGIPTEVIEKYVPVSIDESESLEDDFKDVANYCIIAILLMRGEWEDERTEFNA